MSENVEIIDLPSLKQIELLGEEVLQNNKSIKDLSLFYHFKNGKLTIEKTPLKLKEFEAIFYGSTSISQQIDYTIETEAPISLINSSTAGLGGLIGGSSILGDMKDRIPISINIGGTVTSPIFNTKLMGGIDNIKENVLSIGKEKVKEKIEDVKNELFLEAEKKAEKIVNEAKMKADQIRKEANNKAEKLEEEAKKKNQIAHSEIKKQVKDLKQKGYNEAELLIKQANSPLAKLAAQKGADELKKSTDRKAKDLEKKLINKANSAEKTAFSAANKIRIEGNNKADLLEKKSQSVARKIIDTAKNK
jgi:cell division septum initiation protein DivIVA